MILSNQNLITIIMKYKKQDMNLECKMCSIQVNAIIINNHIIQPNHFKVCTFFFKSMKISSKITSNRNL